MNQVRCFVVGFSVFVTLVIGGGPAAAQEATPTADRIVPQPEECTIEPISTEALFALATPTVATPTEMQATPDAEETAPPRLQVPFQAPDGGAVDPATAQAVLAVIRQEWACLNANDTRRFLALLSDELIGRAFAPEDLQRIAEGASLDVFGQLVEGTPTAIPPAEQTALIAVLDIERLDDGRVGAYVIVDTFADPLPTEVNYYFLTETDAGWQLDDFLCFGAEGQYC